MGKLIINADDFGFCRGVNNGIIEAYKEGVLTSTTLMANTPGFEEAVQLAKDNPGLGVGVHLNLTFWYPICDNLTTLVQDNGKFKYLTFYEDKNNLDKIDLNEVYREWKAQIDKVISNGIKPTHLDSHHHVNNIGKLKEVFITLAEEYNLPVRNNFHIPKEIKTTEKLMNYFDIIGRVKNVWRAQEADAFIKDCVTYNLIEVMCHPAYVDNFLLENSSLNTNRTSSLKELKNDKLSKMIKDNNIELTNYGKI